MPTIDVDLGHADLRAADSDICVQLTSSARFASSAEDAIDRLRQRLTAARVTDQSIGKPWIHRGNRFSLVLSLHLQALLDVRKRDELVQILAGHIQDAKMWDQLCLEPSSLQTSFDDTSGAYTITALLAYTQTAPSSERQLHKLGTDVPVHDVQPPDGIGNVSCEAVHISLSLSQRQRRKRKRREAFENFGNNMDGANHNISTDTQTQPGEEDDLFWPCEDASAEVDEHLYLSGPEEGGLDIHCDNKVDELAMMFGDDFPGLGDQEMRDPARSSPKYMSSETLANMSNNTVTSRRCVQAIEYALQLAICGASCHSKRRHSIEDGGDVSPLADVMPSIWSPDYLPAVASRAIFIPTIAHALTSVLERADDRAETESSRRSKTAKMALGLAESHSKKSTGSTVPPQLWWKLQTALYRKNAARRLSPLGEAVGEEICDRGILEELLDGDEAYTNETEILDHGEDRAFMRDDYDDMLGDDMNEYAVEDEISFFDAWEDGALEDGLEDAVYLDLDPSTSSREPGPARGFRSATPDGLLDHAKSEATSTRQSGEPKLMSTTSQLFAMPSQLRVSTGNLTPWERKQPAASQRNGSSWLPEEAGRRCTVRDDPVFEDCGGDEMLITEADLQSISFDGCEMLCT